MIRSGKQTGRIKSPKSIVKYALKEIVIQVFYLYKTISGIYDSEWMAGTPNLPRKIWVSANKLFETNLSYEANFF